MKRYLVLALLGFLSCAKNSMINEEDDKNYSIKYEKYQSSFYVYLKSNNDTLYVEKYGNVNTRKVKINVGHKKNLEIKKIIEDNLKYKYLFAKQIRVTHGNSISFCVDNGCNSLKTSYSDIDNYWSVSNEFGHLIEDLKKDFKEFKDF